MNAIMPGAVSRERRLRALGVTPLRLRVALAPDGRDAAGPAPPQPEGATPSAAVLANGLPSAEPARIRRLALQTDPAERQDAAVNKMYMDLSAAVAKAGLQPVRVCDVAADDCAAVMVFGAASPPADVPQARVLHADALAVLYADRECKRQLWERLLALGRGGDG